MSAVIDRTPWREAGSSDPLSAATPQMPHISADLFVDAPIAVDHAIEGKRFQHPRARRGPQPLTATGVTGERDDRPAPSAAASRAGTSIPQLASTISGVPPTAVAITGSPADMPSRIVSEIPSLTELLT